MSSEVSWVIFTLSNCSFAINRDLYYLKVLKHQFYPCSQETVVRNKTQRSSLCFSWWFILKFIRCSLPYSSKYLRIRYMVSQDRLFSRNTDSHQWDLEVLSIHSNRMCSKVIFILFLLLKYYNAILVQLIISDQPAVTVVTYSFCEYYTILLCYAHFYSTKLKVRLCLIPPTNIFAYFLISDNGYFLNLPIGKIG